MTRDERQAAACRRHAAALIRCMDFRDVAGARGLVTRLAARGELDGVVPWVWRIEAERAAAGRAWLAERAARARVYQASPGWRLTRQAPEVPRAA